MKKQSFDIVIWSILTAFVAAFFVGWCMNIYAIITSDFVWTGMFVARLAGVFIAPLGGVLGYF